MVLTVLKKVSIMEFAYLVRSCVELRRGVKLQSASARDFVELVALWVHTVLK